MSAEEHYGEQWRAWPGGCECHGEGDGYFSNYRQLFARIFAVDDRTYLSAEQDDAGFWRWAAGRFSWTPDGDLYESVARGMNATRAIAERECRAAAASFNGRLAEVLRR